MNKKIALCNVEIADVIKKYFENKQVDVILSDEISDCYDCDLIVTYNYFGEYLPNLINIHPSLLPAYNCEDAISKAYVDGVKVSGITIKSKDRIIAQYPVLIGIDTNIAEFEQDILDVQKKLLPPVIEAILDDRVFDFHDLFRTPCNHTTGGCSGCAGCH